MKHPCLQMTAPRTGIAGEGKPYRISPEDQAGKLDLKASLKGRRRARYPGQRAALRSNVDWPLRYAHCGKRTGCVPPGPDVPGVLSTSSVRVRTRTGRIKPAEPPRVAPFFIRLSVSPIRLTRPCGAGMYMLTHTQRLRAGLCSHAASRLGQPSDFKISPVSQVC